MCRSCLSLVEEVITNVFDEFNKKKLYKNKFENLDVLVHMFQF